MRYLKSLSMFLLLSIICGCDTYAVEKIKQLKAFPEAEQGMQRFVINLDEKIEGEDNYRIEIIPGATMETDGVNRVRLGYQIKAFPLKGWGYTYYKVVGKGVAMSTKMAPRQGVPTVTRFVQGQGLTINYNSKLPIVIYAPQDCEIQYRTWSVENSQSADKG
ncbi:MAG: ecotin family protein [Lentisphaerales bacterium]|nr:ecotin family protein [Lentisphaerales bacterium]